MPCCETWKPVENCTEPNSLKCIDFQGLSQIIANLTLAEREAEMRNLPGAYLDSVLGVARNLCFVSTLSLMMTVTS